MKQRWRNWVPVALLVVVPLALLYWQGVREAKITEDRLRAEVHRQAAVRVEGFLDTLSRWLRSEELNLASALQSEDLRQVSVRHPLVVETFALGNSGQLLWPDTLHVLSASERAFVGRTRALWDGRVALESGWSPDEELNGLASRGERSSGTWTGGAQVVWLSEQRPRGWIPWHWEDGLHLLFWCRGSDEYPVLGAEVDRTALLSRWVGASPERDLGGGEFRLVDDGGKVLHSFGPWKAHLGEAPILSEPLPHPLRSWRVEYRGPESEWMHAVARSEQQARLWRWGIVTVLFLLLAALYLRESRRAFREALQRVNFVNQVSHELRTPLTNIRLYAELAHDGTAEEDTAQKLDVIQQESERLSRLVANVLAFAREEKGSLKVHCVSMELDSWLNMVVAAVEPAMRKRGIVVDVDREQMPARPFRVLLDADAGTQILINLLSNAEKYAASGGWVGVRVSRENGRVQLRVRDRGPGIARRNHRRIFEPFFRVGGKVTDGVAGTGIGLSIARRLALLMGGNLMLEESRPGKGACFVWTLREA